MQTFTLSALEETDRSITIRVVRGVALRMSMLLYGYAQEQPTPAKSAAYAAASDALAKLDEWTQNPGSVDEKFLRYAAGRLHCSCGDCLFPVYGKEARDAIAAALYTAAALAGPEISVEKGADYANRAVGFALYAGGAAEREAQEVDYRAARLSPATISARPSGLSLE